MEIIYRPLSMSRSNSKQAFTLIELLIVVSIIALLAAILFPVFGRARENARRSSCQSNMKQLGLGLMQYSQDYDERMPCGLTIGKPNGGGGGQHWSPGQGWAGQVYPYVKSTRVYTCPSDTRRSVGSLAAVSYGFNNNLIVGPSNDPGGSNQVGIAALVEPTKTIALTEGSSTSTYDVVKGEPTGATSPIANGIYYINGWRANNSGDAFCSAGRLGNTRFACGTSSGGFDGTTPNGRHLDGSNFLFFDGHVKWLKGSAVSPGRNAASSTSVQQVPGYASNAAGTSGKFSDGTVVAATYSIR